MRLVCNRRDLALRSPLDGGRGRLGNRAGLCTSCCSVYFHRDCLHLKSGISDVILIAMGIVN